MENALLSYGFCIFAKVIFSFIYSKTTLTFNIGFLTASVAKQKKDFLLTRDITWEGTVFSDTLVSLEVMDKAVEAML